MIPTRKLKGEDYDIYECRQCYQQWKSYYKRIGHKACPKR